LTLAQAGRPRKSPEKPVEVGQVFAARLREARNARGWTQQELANAMEALGAPMDRTTIAKLEKGQRQARVEELVALAAALDVSPLYLILPLRIDTTVRLTPKLTVEAIEALKWARGEGPLDPANERTYRFQAPTAPWVTWTPGEPGEVTFGGLEGWQARGIARELERQDRERDRG
jgi:transcriptional regulator with XRE-family HTH domain